MVLQSFCGILTLQVGVAMMACVFWVIASLAFVVNISDVITASHFSVAAILLLVFGIIMTVSGLILFLSAYNESKHLCKIAMGVTALSTVFWVLSCGLSFYNNASFLDYVCIEHRCPESFWLAPLNYRKYSDSGETSELYTTDENYSAETEAVENKLTTGAATEESKETSSEGTEQETESVQSSETVELSTDVHERRDEPVGFNFLVRLNSDYLGDPEETPSSTIKLVDPPSFSPNSENEGTTEGTGSDSLGYDFGVYFFVAIILFLVNFATFIFTIIVVWSYSSELKWVERFSPKNP